MGMLSRDPKKKHDFNLQRNKREFRIFFRYTLGFERIKCFHVDHQSQYWLICLKRDSFK